MSENNKYKLRSPTPCLKCNSGSVKYDKRGVGVCNVCGDVVQTGKDWLDPERVPYKDASERVENLIRLAKLRSEVDRLEELEQTRAASAPKPVQAKVAVSTEKADPAASQIEPVTEKNRHKPGRQTWGQEKQQIKEERWIETTAQKLVEGIEAVGYAYALTRELIQDSVSLVRKTNLRAVIGDDSAPLMPLVGAFIYASGYGKKEYRGLQEYLVEYLNVTGTEIAELSSVIKANRLPAGNSGKQE